MLPAIQDPIQKSDPRIVFCVAWAKGGYLPTHNPNYRQPQGKDPVWNNANCRNRRLFNDRAVKKVAANTKPFLLQTYRRDMGGGNFVLMKDLSSPIIDPRPPLGRLPDGIPGVEPCHVRACARRPWNDTRWLSSARTPAAPAPACRRSAPARS